MKKVSKVLALCLAMVLVMSSLAACGGSSAPAAPAATEAAPAETLAVSGSNGETAVAADEMYDTITLAQNQDITNMNPWVATNSSYNVIGPEIYETLGAYDAFGGTFQGVLMSDWEFVDEKTVDVTLFENIYDTAGNHFTASDVVFSCTKCWEKGELAETAIVETVEALDEYKVRFVFKKAMGLGDFESVMYNINMVTEAAFNASPDEMGTTPVGTGPYALKEYVTGVSVSIEATGNYWQDPDKFVVPTQYSNVKNIVCQVISESAQLATALQTGSIAISDSIEGESAKELLASADFGAFVYVDPNGRSLMCNMSPESPMSDINLRLAVAYAIDQESVMAFVNGGNTEALATFGSTSYGDYNQAWNETNFPYNVDLAKEYLAKSNYPDGVTLKMNVIAGKESDAETALVLQQQLAEIGVDVEIQTLPIGQYLPLEHDPKGWDIAASGFPTYTGYLANAWQKYFDLNTLGSTETKNFWSDAKCQELMDACLNPQTYSSEAYDAFVSYLQENAVCKGLYTPTKNIIYNTGVIESVVLNQALYMVPGAFTYAK